MSRLHLYCTLFIFLLSSLFYLSYGQDCLEYPEIGGAECVVCVPDDWDVLDVTSPDIIPGDGTWPGGNCMVELLGGESPGGGNMSLFVATGGFYEEGMETTVGGLDTGQEYGFGLYWQNVLLTGCGIWEGGDLLIVIDGEEYEFSGADEWEFIEICFTPSSSSIDIQLSIIGTGGQNALVVDSPTCEQVTPCCPLKVLIEEETLEICPGEELVFPGVIDDAEGSVSIEWTSDPSDGVDYLDDPNTLNPTFLLDDTNNFEGEEYIFTLTVEDVNCEKIQEFELIVNPSIVPDFEIYLCEVYENPDLPTESLEGFTGLWTGDFNFNELGGTIQEYVFTLDPGQDNCIEEWTYEVPIDEAIELTFDIQDFYCELDDERYRLPDESEEKVEGEWDEDRIIPSDLGEGVYIFTFFPYTDEFCAFPFELEIEVFEAESISFNLPQSFCATGDTFYMPSTSSEMIQGTWDEEFIILNNTGDYEFEFVVEDPNDCYFDYVYSFTIEDNASASFDLPTAICRSSPLFQPESNSIEGYEGIWSPVSVIPNEITEQSFDLSWTPINDFNGCLKETTITIDLIDEAILEFNIPDSLCISDLPYTLPLLSNNNLSGLWNMQEVESSSAPDEYVYILFEGDSTSCFAEYMDSIFITGLTAPEFSLITTLCPEDADYALPQTAINNISGSWDTPVIDPSQVIDSIVVLFTPDDMQCADIFQWTIKIEESLTPLFTLPEFFCPDDNGYIFENISDNGISGTWQFSSYDYESLKDEFVIFNLFTPDVPECYDQVEVSIPVTNLEDYDVMTTDPANCEFPDGLIDITSSRDLEYSIDNGLSWTTDAFNSLSSGSYNVYIRSSNYPECIDSVNIVLSSPQFATIVESEVVQPDNCDNNNGSVELTAEGMNLEFSIDNGQSWQSNNNFTDLAPGSYNVIARPNGEIACSDKVTINVSEFTPTRILMTDQIDISDCDVYTGEISIVAEGVELEYSIDNGANYQMEGLFENLAPGNYDIIVRSTVDPGCTDRISLEITGVDPPQITESIVVDISDCGNEDGSIILMLENDTDLEYSLDQLNWQASNVFDNLSAGVYQLYVRKTNTINCIDSTTVAIDDAVLPVVDDLNISDVSDCVSEDGKIEIITNELNLELSIDDGQRWQTDKIFNQLPPGNYTLLFRKINQESCIDSIEFEILDSACPCQVIEYAYELELPDCVNPFSGSIELIDLNGFYTDLDYTIMWNNGQTGTSLFNISEGWYSFQISYDLNCTQTDSIYLESIEPLSFDLLSFDQDCQGLGSIEVTNLGGGSGNPLFSIDGINFQESNVFFNLSADQYNILVSDIFNCDSTANTIINDNSNLELDLDLIEPITVGESVFLNPLINQSTIDDFEWSPGYGILNPGELIAEVAPEETTEYTLTIYFGDCIETRSVNVEVLKPDDVYIPNVFNPSEFNINNTFHPQTRDITSAKVLSLNIYDRWGNLMFINENFDFNDPDQGWDGYYQDRPVEIGVYVYFIEYELYGDYYNSSGSITLIR